MRFSQLSPQRQALIRRCQQIGYGGIGPFHLRDCEPVFEPGTHISLDVKLDSDDSRRCEFDLRDFELNKEMVRLFSSFDAVGDCAVDHLEVRAGVPRRIVYKAQF